MKWIKKLFCDHNYKKTMYVDFMGHRKLICLNCHKIKTYHFVIDEEPICGNYDYTNKEINKLLNP